MLSSIELKCKMIGVHFLGYIYLLINTFLFYNKIKKLHLYFKDKHFIYITLMTRYSKLNNMTLIFVRVIQNNFEFKLELEQVEFKLINLNRFLTSHKL